MPTLFDPAARERILSRVDRLTPRQKPLWGTMDTGRMIAHMTAQLRNGLGELACEPMKTPLDNWLMRRLVIYWMPWPRGLPTLPEFLPQPSGSWDEDLATFRSVIERFGARDPRGEWPRHPALGALSGRLWGVLSWRHLDHHLRQFGV